jgi:hypothetical protein
MISGKLAAMFGLRFILDREGYDPCDEWDIDAVLGLPEGLTYVCGAIRYECLSCGKLAELPCGVEEFDIDCPYNLCGGSPRCCP